MLGARPTPTRISSTAISTVCPSRSRLQHFVAASPCCPEDFHAELQFNPFPNKGAMQNLRRIPIFPAQDMGTELDECHSAAKAGK